MQKKTVIQKQLGIIQSMKLRLLFTIFSSKLRLLFGAASTREQNELDRTPEIDPEVTSSNSVILQQIPIFLTC